MLLIPNIKNFMLYPHFLNHGTPDNKNRYTW